MIRGGDERGVTVQIGAVLLLAILITALALYQVNSVPAENEVVEIEHNQDVQDDLQEVRNTIVSVPGGNSGTSQSVSLGTSYPPRTFGINPGPMEGSLESEPIGEITIENAIPVDDSDQVSDGWKDGYRTYGLTYSPNYNEYQNAPQTRYEHGLLYNHHPNDERLNVGGQSQLVVDGNEITIVTLQGNYSEFGQRTATVDPREFSTSTNTISVESDSQDPMEVTLPTNSPEHWEETLSETTDHQITANDEIVTITFEPGTYNLRMAEVGIGDATQGSPEDRVEYLWTDEQESATIVEFRDRFNNPVPSAEIDEIENIDEMIGNVERIEKDNLPDSTGSDGRVRIGDLSDQPVSDPGQIQTYGWTVETDGEDGKTVYFTDDGTKDGERIWDLDEDEVPVVTATVVQDRDDRVYTAEIVNVDDKSVTIRAWRSTGLAVLGHPQTEVSEEVHVTATVTTKEIDRPSPPDEGNGNDGGEGDTTFDLLETEMDVRSGDNAAEGVTITFETASEGNTITFSGENNVEEEDTEVVEDTTGGQVELEWGAGGPPGDPDTYPVELVADIEGGLCYTVQLNEGEEAALESQEENRVVWDQC
ncbi:hypothetical protein [Natrarchaeobaculum aegyptiacum]|uniref:hypothetical protein n=1 Tax=Natrarchaeobaculum aegyptiacum TaxID=745377 RepID=UPI0012600CD7|nr:hypothetical protein [Natrarchaeobaculum aegyptiacum]